MLIRWNTDAPIYYFPWATPGLIGANVAVLAVVLQAEPESIQPWVLSYGTGLHPLQWITSAFLHDGLLHLIGNMIFLWAFGNWKAGPGKAAIPFPEQPEHRPPGHR